MGALPPPRPGTLPDPPRTHRLPPDPPQATSWPSPTVNHAALLYFLHLQATFIHQLSDFFLRASPVGLVRGEWSP